MKTTHPLIAFSNQSPTLTANGWLKLADYGDWPHSRGLQRLSRKAARRMVSHFKSLSQRLARRFGGIPLYVGHPDDPHFSGKAGHNDTRAYAWIRDMDARPDGLYILPKWSESGQHLLKNAYYKFLSPRWAMEPVKGSGGVFEPIRLLSVGLTNEPNIPGEALANAKPNEVKQTITPTFFMQVAEKLELEPTESSIKTVFATLDERLAEADRFYQIACSAEDQRYALQLKLKDANEHFEAERQAHIETLLSDALENGRIAPGELESWRERCHDDFAATRTELASRPKAANARPLSEDLTGANATSGDSFRHLVQTLVAEGRDYATAWSLARRRYPSAYARLR